MAGIDENTKLLLHCDGADASTTFTDSAGGHTVTGAGNAQIDTAQSVFGGASLLLDGTGDSLSSVDSADWDINAVLTESWTIDWRQKFNATTGLQNIINQFVSSNTYWRVIHFDGNGFAFQAIVSGGDYVILDYGGEINDTNWHHVALVKVGGASSALWAMYVDGTQVSYLSVGSGSVYNYTGSLYIGELNGGNYFNGWMDELRIQKSNYFNANPNAGKTDTITVPSAAYSVATAGPANVKTINGLAIASVKTVKGLAIASVKSYNGLT